MSFCKLNRLLSLRRRGWVRLVVRRFYSPHPIPLPVEGEGDRRNYHLSDPAFLYSVTLVSKKFFSFFRSIISLIHGNGLAALYTFARPIRSSLRSAMYCKYSSMTPAFSPRMPFGKQSCAYADSN